ncbi:hypothetical protein PMSD_17235 [Paenibacillus macquariensis subsp. defensor]|nr:hypothetical protein PMSD_17235 [Paenibacillus macquariensis subsp. defensor]
MAGNKQEQDVNLKEVQRYQLLMDEDDMSSTNANHIQESINDFSRHRIDFEDLRSRVQECCKLDGVDFYKKY